MLFFLTKLFDLFLPLYIKWKRLNSHLIIFFTVLPFLQGSILAQGNERYIINNFDRKDFNASLSNWDVTQDNRGIIYIANYDGILSYNSHSWKTTLIKNNLIGLSIAKDYKNRIFVGTLGGFGYLKPDQLGRLSYFSLIEKLPEDMKLGAFWSILPTKTGTYLHSSDLIVKWSDGEIAYWKSDTNIKFRFAFNVNDTFYTSQKEKGLLKLDDGVLDTLPDTKPLAEQVITLIDQYNDTTLLIGTSKGEFHLIHDGSITANRHINTKVASYIYTNSLYTSEKTPTSSDNQYALGTLRGGIVILDSALQLINIINKSTGLSSDVIRGLFYDQTNNLWSAMNEGVSLIEIRSPWKFWGNDAGLFGIPNVVMQHKNNLYIGTSEGLFQINQDSLFKSPTIKSKVWDLNEVSGEILVASQNGLNIHSDKKVYESLQLPEATRLHTVMRNDSTFLIVGHSNGISIFHHYQNQWQKYKSYDIPNPAFKTLVIDEKGRLWISAKFKGLYQINNPFKVESPEIIKYDTTSGLPDINEIKIIKKDNQLIFTTSKGFYRFNEQTNRFEPDSSILKERININNIAEDKYGNYIISVIDENRKSHVEMLKKVGNEYIRDYIPFRRLPEMEITAIYPDDNYIWIAGGEGLFRFDRNVKKDYTIPFNTLVSQVSVRDSVIFYGNYYDPSDTTGVPPIILDQPEIFKPKLEFKDNNLTFNFSATFYEAPERTLYSYYLENNEEEWSKWSTNTTKEYNNLSAGTYTFHVKSKNIYDTVGRIASYEFTILPPWYQTTWAYILFTFLAILFVWFIALLYTYRVRMQRRRLKLIVADRTYEVISQKKEIEKQKDLLQLQFEKISKQKDSIEQKNTELQSAQQGTLRANEALQQLNLHLEKEVEKRTEKIKSTLDQLQLKNKELDTFIYRASHDLKGPISRISGLSTLVKMGFPKDADTQYIDLIEATAKNMKVLISKLTQVHDLHNTTIKKAPVNVEELLKSIKLSLEHLGNEDNVHYNFIIEEDIELISDVDLLTIVLQNLMENALVFRKPRDMGQRITIDVKRIGKDVVIKVHDIGTGIHPNHMDRLFEMFYRGSNDSLGSGLGLYLAKMAIDRLNGTIEVKSELHEYTEFTITIPP